MKDNRNSRGTAEGLLALPPPSPGLSHGPGHSSTFSPVPRRPLGGHMTRVRPQAPPKTVQLHLDHPQHMTALDTCHISAE